MRLVTLAQARSYLRVDTTDGDTEIGLLIEVASDLVVNYLGEGADAWLDSEGQPYNDSLDETEDVPDAVKGAVLYLVGVLYRHRDGDPDKAWTPGYLPAPVVSMLYNLRDPALA